ncbi:Microsomal glutathione S-transferase 3 [Lobulomyces angularis]|nr:Microsomal glutathione S-transferase 3 [Lobulomyces angularis]
MTSFESITLSSSFGYVLFTIVLTQIQCAFAAFNVSAQRKKHNIKYPDMGCGIYANKLNPKDWEEFNIYQRVHYNYLEDLNLITMLTLVSSVNHPILSAKLNCMYIFGRFLYGIGYTKYGPSGG